MVDGFVIEELNTSPQLETEKQYEKVAPGIYRGEIDAAEFGISNNGNPSIAYKVIISGDSTGAECQFTGRDVKGNFTQVVNSDKGDAAAKQRWTNKYFITPVASILGITGDELVERMAAPGFKANVFAASLMGREVILTISHKEGTNSLGNPCTFVNITEISGPPENTLAGAAF